MITYLAKKDNKVVPVDKEAHASWIQMQPPFEPNELQVFADEHQIPIDFLTDPLDRDSRSRYEVEDDALLIIINTPVLNEEASENESIYYTEPIGIILIEDKIVTISSEGNPIIESFVDNKVRYFNPDDHKLFVLQIFGKNVVSFLDSIKKLNLRRNLIEQELYNSSRNKELQQLLKIEKSLVYFVNSISANDLLKMKMSRTDVLKIRSNERYSDLFEDIIIDSGQALDMSKVHTNILSGTMETYSSIISNNMNLFINRLTIITIVLMVPTLIASLYGMNVDLPGQNWPHMFKLLLFISFMTVVGLIIFFRRDNKL